MPAVSFVVRGQSGPSGQDLGPVCVAATGGAAGPALPAGADLPAGLPGHDRAVRVHRGRERPAHPGRAVDQAGWPGGPGPAACPLGPARGPVPGTGRSGRRDPVRISKRAWLIAWVRSLRRCAGYLSLHARCRRSERQSDLEANMRTFGPPNCWPMAVGRVVAEAQHAVIREEHAVIPIPKWLP